MTFKCLDFVKLTVLLSTFILCLHSARVKFAVQTEQSVVIPPISSLKSVYEFKECDFFRDCVKCDNGGESLKQCSSELSVSYVDAEKKCNGYLKNLGTCQHSSNVRKSQCRIELSNVEGCVKSVLTDVRRKWTEAAVLQTNKST